MLRELHLRNTGPAPRLDVEFAERLNVFTGDNGLGKTFLLDVAWWALTGTWAGHAAAPHRPGPAGTAPPAVPATISWQRRDHELQFDRRLDPRTQQWERPDAQSILREPPPRSIAIYARVDGGISVWDPLRNLWNSLPQVDFPSALVPNGRFCFHFSRESIANGLVGLNERPICNGMIHDWVMWQLQSDRGARLDPFEILRSVLGALSPDPTEALAPGEPVRVFRDDPRDFPTLVFPHGVVPVVHASAGMKRILGLAYIVVWAWYEHLRAAELAGEAPTTSLVFLLDEVEAHLHPQWQRRLLPALLRVLKQLLVRDTRVQFLATTHSPLVLASLEPHFEPELDRLFRFALNDGQVVLHDEAWAKEGDVLGWLVSDAFGLQQARSVEAEQAIEAAEAWMRGDRTALPGDLGDEASIHAALRRLLPGDDPFWPRWIVRRRAEDRA